MNLQEQFGSIDVYLFDQLLKGRITLPMRILDAGCGAGRNIVYLLREGYDVCAVDTSPDAIKYVQDLAASLSPHLPEDNFRLEAVEQLSFKDESFDAVISSAVLHFARDERHWRQMVREMWRVLKPDGILFARLASTKGVEKQIALIEGRRFVLPDGNTLFLVDDDMLIEVSNYLEGELIEPVKSVVVGRERSMAVWCLRKR